jgi:hypothetical protein
MKRLLLALLVSGVSITAVDQTSADCIWYKRYYSETPGGPTCGSLVFFCEAGPQYQDCQTPYYRQITGCQCP